MRRARQRRQRIARLFFRKRWLFGANVLLASQFASRPIYFHGTGFEREDPSSFVFLGVIHSSTRFAAAWLDCSRARVRSQVSRCCVPRPVPRLARAMKERFNRKRGDEEPPFGMTG